MDETNSVEVSDGELARVAHLAAILFRDGASENNLLLIEQLPSVGKGRVELAQDQIHQTQPAPPSAQASSSQYQSLDRDIFLRHSAYVDRDDRASLDDALVSMYATAGIQIGDLPVDHVAAQLTFLSVLVQHSPEKATEFASEYLFKWIAPVYAIVHRVGSEVDRAAANLVIEMLSQLQRRGGSHSDRDLEEAAQATVSAEQSESTETTPHMKSFVRRLANPNECGMFIDRDILLGLSREFNLPVGFGSRYQMCETLCDSAQRYGKLPSVLGSLHQLFQRETETYRSLAARLAPGSALDPWILRAEQTQSEMKYFSETATLDAG